jgi:hypothetical protein
VTNEIDVAHRLVAHHADQRPVLLIAPEHDSGGDLGIELVLRHVGFVPPVGRDYSAISLSGSVDDCEDGGALVITTAADVAHEANFGARSLRNALL